MPDLEESPSASAARYDLIVPVWGAKYVDMFVNYCLPSQLAAGNLPSLPSGRCSYHIYTTQEDAKAIWTSPSVGKLRKLMDVSLVTFRDEAVLRDSGLSDRPYVKNLQKMTWCYQRAMQTCRGADTAFVFMTPDSIWANGAFRYLDECQRAGIRALMGLGLITHREKLQHELAAFRDSRDGAVIDVPPRSLVSLALDALHPLAITKIIKNGGSRFVSAYYWAKPRQGLVARCFYLHPIMVRPRVRFDYIPFTVDYRYIAQAVPNPDEVRVITDSDNLFYVDMADLHHEAVALNLENATRSEILDWMCDWTDTYHRKYFAHSIIIHENDINDDFEDELAAAQCFADALLEAFADYHPVSGRTLFPSNLYFGDALQAHQARQAPFAVQTGPAAQLPLPISEPESPQPSPQPTPSWLRRWTVALPRRAARKCYRFFTARLTARINQLEATLALCRRQALMTEHKLAQFEQFVRVLEKRLETPATGRSEVHLTPYLIRAEFQIRAEIERLRLDLHRHVNQHQQLRLLNNPDNPKAAG